MPPKSKKATKGVDKASGPAQRSKKSNKSQRVPATPSPAFPRFALLPQELQNMIWQCAIDAFRPRVVDVKEGTYIKTRRGAHLRKRQFTSPCPIPNVLHACRNSRHLALKRWRLSFATDDDPARIFIDFSSDTLYFDYEFGSIEEFTDRVKRDDLKRVRKIAFDTEWQLAKDYYDDGISMSHSLRMDFPGLTHLVIPEEDYDVDWNLFGAKMPQLTTDPNKTVILFFESDEDEMEWRTFDDYILDEFVEHREIMGWSHVKILWANYCRSPPGQEESTEREIIETRYGGYYPGTGSVDCSCSVCNEDPFLYEDLDAMDSNDMSAI